MEEYAEVYKVEAADLVERESFDVIITDMKMPGMDGAAFYRQVRQRDPAQARRIIFITGDTASDETLALLAQAGTPCIEKPFRVHQFMATVEKMIGKP